jgi:hypothetical protein
MLYLFVLILVSNIQIPVKMTINNPDKIKSIKNILDLDYKVPIIKMSPIMQTVNTNQFNALKKQSCVKNAWIHWGNETNNTMVIWKRGII